MYYKAKRSRSDQSKASQQDALSLVATKTSIGNKTFTYPPVRCVWLSSLCIQTAEYFFSYRPQRHCLLWATKKCIAVSSSLFVGIVAREVEVLRARSVALKDAQVIRLQSLTGKKCLGFVSTQLTAIGG